MKKKIQYFGYTITYYLFPGKNLEKTELVQIHQNILDMNVESGTNFKYGIFDHSKPFSFKKEFYDRILLVTIHDESGRNAGFFYNFIIENQKNTLIHQGLVVIFNNKGVDLLKAPYLYANILLHEFFNKDFYISNISAVPLIIGTVSEIFSEVWPSATAEDLRFPPKQYIQLAELLQQEYIGKYFPEGTIFDKKRFVLKSPLKEMGFGVKIRNLPRHPSLTHNVFTNVWIDLENGEDVVQIGVMSKKTYNDFVFYLKKISFNIGE